jgi:hypothetical protein
MMWLYNTVQLILGIDLHNIKRILYILFINNQSIINITIGLRSQSDVSTVFLISFDQLIECKMNL